MTAATLLRFRSQPLASPLPGVSNEQWTRLARALEVQPPRAISESGGYGSYDLRPRRLVELGLANNLRVTRTPSGRQAHACDLLLPLTEKRLLTDPLMQLVILRRAIASHHAQLCKNEITRPEGVTIAGGLAILHVGGRGALASWPNLFDETRALYEAARGAF